MLRPNDGWTQAFATHPARLFWAFALLHLAAWTIIPHLASPNIPLDVIEGYAWGREWLLGTYKHPPMQAWWLEILATLTGRAPWAHLLASQIAIVVAFWAVWQTGRRLTDETTALLGALLLEGVVYYNYTTPEFNPNVLQPPFWALMAWSFHRAVKENKLRDWVLFGLWCVCGMYSKYTSALMIGLLCATLLHPEARRRLLSPGPYLAAGFALLLFAPHIQWLIAHDFQPFFYATSRAEEARHWYEHITMPLGFMAAQAVDLAAMVFLVFTLRKDRVRKSSLPP